MSNGYVVRAKSSLLNGTTKGNQFDSHLVRLTTGGLAVTWVDTSETNQDTDGRAIMARVYNGSGKPIGDEIAVNTVTEGDQLEPTITTLKSGNFVVAWAGGTFNDYDVRAQMFNKAGKPVGSEFVINKTTDLVQHAPVLTPLANGGFVAVWQSNADRGFGYDDSIKAQYFNAKGKPVGTELTIDEIAHPSNVAAAATTLSDGSVVITWTNGYDNGRGQILGQHLSASGKAVGGNFVVEEYAHPNGARSSVTALSGGGFMVAWDAIEPRGINARIFSAAGKAVGPTFLVSDEYANYESASVVQLANKDIVVAYETDRGALVAQIFDKSGTKLGSELLITDSGTNAMVQVLANKGGGFSVTWTDGNAEDGDGTGIHLITVDLDTSFHNLKGGADGDTLQAATSAQWHVFGLGGDDKLIGNIYADIIDGGSGADRMGGLSGDDRYIVDNKGDLVFEDPGQGRDTISSSVSYTLPDNVEVLQLTGKSALSGTGNDDANTINGNVAANRLDGGRGDDVLAGGDGGDTLVGGMGNDRLDGGRDADRLTGGAGDDVLDGGAGKDMLIGEAGKDSFVFDDGDGGKTRDTADRIADFSHGQGDRIDLSAIDANAKGKGDQVFKFIGAKAFTGHAGELHYELSGGHTYVSGDTNGDKKADFIINLDHAVKLLASDFIL
jgi:Ca2+-binding RTX toxin-like protein